MELVALPHWLGAFLIPVPSGGWWPVSVSCQLIIAPKLCLLWDPYLLADHIAIIGAFLGSLSQTGPGL